MKKHFFFCLLLSFSLAINAQETELLAFNGSHFIKSTDYTGVTIQTQITVEKEGNYTLITFWEETDNGFLFKNENWEGNVTLELENGTKIELLDRNMDGQEMLRGGYIAGYFVPDSYQRYSSYFLTDAECALLKNSRIKTVAYLLNSETGIQKRYLSFDTQGFSLQDQLVAIGK